jgi:hypothetical protein
MGRFEFAGPEKKLVAEEISTTKKKPSTFH